MSYTEIYSFGKDGKAKFYAAIKNSWRGAMAIWSEMEKRHLPPYIPDYIKYCNWYRQGMPFEEIVMRNGFEPTRVSAMTTAGKNPLQEVWDLADNLTIPEHERIALFTTFDGCLIKREDCRRVAEVFRRFEGDTSLDEQAVVLDSAAADSSIIAIGWNQTSVCANSWENAGGYDEIKDTPIPYNCLTGTKHFWLFDEMKQGEMS